MSKKKWIGLFILYTILLAGMPSGLIAQETDLLLKKEFSDYQEHALQEKIYLHTDKNFYLAGEICWFKVYNTDGFFNRPLSISKIAYVEVMDKAGKPVLQAKIPLQDGGGNGSLQWPVTLQSGQYLLRAYTNWMKNFSPAYFFEKPVTIINTRKIAEAVVPQKQKFDIQFFPEGGNLVNGIQSRVAFRVADQNGKGITCAGFIQDEKADTQAVFSTLKFGLGNFLFTPVAGHTYKATILMQGGQPVEAPVPNAYSSGYVMQVNKSENGKIKIAVQSLAVSGTAVYLFAHTRGLMKASLSNTLRNGAAEFIIDTASLGEGISQLTVFGADRQPVCERLYFKQPARCFHITAATDQPIYASRKKISIQVSSVGANGKAVAAGMSVGVYRTDSLMAQDEMDISNYLWLSADLEGTVESPGYYFNADTEEAADNLMLTQGWRRFRWQNVLGQTTPAVEFVPEYKGHFVKGKVVSNANNQPVRGVESFLSVAGTRTQFRGAVSDNSGNLKFEMKDFYGNNEIIIQESHQTDGLNHIEVSSPFSDKFSGTTLPSFLLPEKSRSVLQNDNIALQVQNTYSGARLKHSVLPALDTNAFYSKPDNAYLLDDYVRFTTVEEVLREYVPDVNVRKKDGKFSLPVFDNVRKEFFTVEPLVLLDGVPVLDADKIMRYDPLKIRKLEVVARMYFYGNMYFGGIVNFITYHGDLPGYEMDPHATVIDYETLQPQREFFSPLYETEQEFAGRMPDFRTLLYWSPDVKTSKEGKKEIEFYSSDLSGHYAVVLQGLTPDGRTGSKTVFFDVSDAGNKKN